MKNNNHLFSSLKVITSILLVFVLVAQMPMNVDAQMASPATSQYMETSSSGPQRISMSVSRSHVNVTVYDESLSNSYEIIAQVRDYSDNTVTRAEEKFLNGQCNLILDMSTINDGLYKILMWKYQPYVTYDYMNTYEIRVSNGIPLFYSANGQGQIDFVNWINAFCDPENYRGMSYWVQTTSNYDEIAELTRNITANCTSDEEKVRAIHDWLCRNISYDYEAYLRGDISNRADASWVYNNRRGVCSGYSRLASVMLTAVGIPKMNVQGHAYNMEENVEYDVNHEWNLVYYNGSWHIFDFTHDSKNAYYGIGDSRTVSGQEPQYTNYDVTPFASGMKYLTINSCDVYNYDGYGQPVYRLYNRHSGEHFFTFNRGEANALISYGWRYEGESWKSPLRSSTLVYRVYNPNSGEHHYTMNWNEAVFLAFSGWNYEGIAWHSDDEKRVPVYRLYNPNAIGAGSHHYTSNFNEAVFLAFSGWNYEGIGWYGV